MNSKNIIIALIIVALLIVAGILFTQSSSDEATTLPTEAIPVEPDNGIGDGAEPVAETDDTPAEGGEVDDSLTVLGSSAGGHDITAFHFGSGSEELLFIGGVHGGYSWSTTLVAYELIEYLEDNPGIIPEDLKVTVIPVANPDGLAKAFGAPGRFDPARGADVSEAARIAGRFNDASVDLNRNFDCEWSSDAVWRDQSVGAGDEAFSEPEAQALRTYIEEANLVGAVVWFGSEGKVYPSACGTAPSAASAELAATFATAAGYPAEEEFDAYAITGDMVNWMAKEGIPAISVLLTSHDNTEWSKNRAGIDAVLASFATTE